MENSDGCKNFSLSNLNEEFPPMVMISEGNCNIKQKAANAEHAGAEMLIIIRMNETSHTELAEKTHDMVNMFVDIPTITISFQNGSKLSELMRTKG